MKTICLAMTFCLISSLTSYAQKEVTAAQVNGTWKYRQNEFKIWALGQQKLQVEFSGVWEHKDANGDPTANTGEGAGIIRIDGDTANFKPDGAEDECKIVLKFTDGKLIVTQDGICGFGFNVTAAGTYKKISSKKPKFDSQN